MFLILKFCVRTVSKFFWATAKILILYLVVGFIALIATNSYEFAKQYSATNDEGKAYAICMFTMRTFEPGATDYSSCNSYKELSHIKSGKIITKEPEDGECPEGYELRSVLARPLCVQVSR